MKEKRKPSGSPKKAKKTKGGKDEDSLKLPFHTLEYAANMGIPREQHPLLQKMAAPHVDSFNFMLNEGLALAVRDLEPVEFEHKGERLRFWLEEATIGTPTLSEKEQYSAVRTVYPTECRERAATYSGALHVRLMFSLDGHDAADEPRELAKTIGQVPMMVKSDRCALRNLGPAQLVRHGEEAEEWGGYFIINGNEKLIRMLIMPRRNFPTGIVRNGYKKRGPLYTEFGVAMRCVRPDQTALTNTVHYLNNGSCTLRFSYFKNEYIIPLVLVLKALTGASDRQLFQRLVGGAAASGAGAGAGASSSTDGGDNRFVVERAQFMLREAAEMKLYTRAQCLAHLGKHFRVVLKTPARVSDVAAGEELLRKLVLVHLDSARAKFDALLVMTRKLYALVQGECAADNPDSPQNQEILLGGHLYNMILKEKLGEWLQGIRQVLQKEARLKKGFSLTPGGGGGGVDQAYLAKCLTRNPVSVQRKMEYFMATGNLTSATGLDLQQVSGFTVVADKLNFYRYLSHFRCVHRGAFFTEMRTTAVRKLLPEAWGFLCPVHTPDGSPCGLLNHMARNCEVVNALFTNQRALAARLVDLGMAPAAAGLTFPDAFLPVMLDGRLVGHVDPAVAPLMVADLRYLKATRAEEAVVPAHLEAALVLPSSGGQWPGLFLFTAPARMIRPVRHLKAPADGPRDELVGSFEQVYMDIACLDEDYEPGLTTHQELLPTNMLSIVAQFTPWSDFNQSPRNMYQCQMGKQTMATPCHAFQHRADNKLYRIQTPQTPMPRPLAYDEFGVDTWATGTNAVVAVISYTGYDMEDAMILNKGSYDRGFAHGTVYKSQVVDLGNLRERGEPIRHHFGLLAREAARARARAEEAGTADAAVGLEPDGFPAIGTRLESGDPLYSVVDEGKGTARVERYKGLEPAVVDEVRLCGSDLGNTPAQRAIIKLRVNRNPIIGDKFASRHGQKGICSQKWPEADMPFSESGIAPDILFNPHGFPSRMTIGMMVESMAGKAGALHGVGYDATPFRFSEDNSAVAYFGDQLRQAGFNFYGNERMYSGVTGREFQADIFKGVVYYQRLRHMVSDKYQVRTTGPVHNLTQQPVKGRKRAGGIRFGEMERDALLAHGTSYLLYDRLMKCSDYSQSHICALCGSILSPALEEPQVMALSKTRSVECRSCQTSKGIKNISLPYVFRYLVAELLAMNIRVVLDLN